MAEVVVVGAGSAGCVVAARLSDAGHRVTLVEGGPDWSGTPTEGRLASVSWLEAMASPEAFDAGMLATRLEHDAPRQYHRGRGLGGSASVNAMLALPGLPGDYDGWARDLGLDDWSWTQVEPVLESLKPRLTASRRSDFTPVDRALVDAAGVLGMPTQVDTYTAQDGAGALWRTADASGRRSSREDYLLPALEHAGLVVRTGARVARVLLDGARATGVELVDGAVLPADEVVLCAGALETPAILLRSGCGGEGVGRGLQDHPAASILLRLRPDQRQVDRVRPCINAVVRASSSLGDGDLHVLPMHGALSVSEPEHHAVLMAAVMSVTSTGEVRLDPSDPTGPPVVEERMLTTEHDRTLLREGIGLVLRLLETAPFREVVELAFVDAQGTPLSALDEPDVYEQWLTTSVGDYFHAVGTARMGRHDDPGAVVDQRGRVHGTRHLRVIDCSVMPTVPSANTHLPVVMVAEKLSAALLEDLHADLVTTTQGASRVDSL